MRKGFQLTLLFGLITTGVFINVKVGLPGHTILWRELNNAGHILLGGFFALLIFRISILFWGHKKISQLWHYFIAASLSGLIGLTIEFMQIFTARDADYCDLFKNLAGILSFLGFLAVFDSALKSFKIFQKYYSRTALLVLSTLLLLSALKPLLISKYAYILRDNQMPRLITFDHGWEDIFIKTQNIEYTKASPPNEWRNYSSAGKIIFKPVQYPKFIINEPYPNWSGYDFLKFEIFSLEKSNILVNIRIEDLRHNNDYNDRFNESIVVKPGLNSLKIKIDDIKFAPVNRTIDLMSIAAIHFYMNKPKKTTVIYIDNIRLE